MTKKLEEITVYGQNVLIEAHNPFKEERKSDIIMLEEENMFMDGGYQQTKESLEYGRVLSRGDDVTHKLSPGDVIAFSKFSLDVIKAPGIKEGSVGVINYRDIRCKIGFKAIK